MFNFWENQLDYLFYTPGLAFLVLTVLCFSLRKQRDQRLPWTWLGFFGASQCFYHWFNVLANCLGESQVFIIVRACIMVISFIFLGKFACAGTFNLQGKRTGRVVLIALLLLGASGGLAGWAGLEAAMRYALGLTGGIWAFFALASAARILSPPLRRSLLWCGVATGLYSLTVGCIVPYAPFAPASLFNQEIFYGLLGIPVQIFEGIFALLAAVSLWFYWRISGGFETLQENWPIKNIWVLPVLLFILFLGWGGTDFLGRQGEEKSRLSLLSRTLTAASALSPRYFSALTGSTDDTVKPDYQNLRLQLMTIHASNADCRFVYLMGLQDGQVIFLADGEPEESKDYSPPGQVYEEASPELFGLFSQGNPFLEGPFPDRWGVWFTGFAPIRNQETSRVIAVLGMDINASDWKLRVAGYRFPGIAISFALSFLTVIFYVNQRWTQESAARTAASERRLRTIFESAPEAICIINADTSQILMDNPFMSHWLGYRPVELRELTLDLLLESDAADGVRDHINSIVKENRVITGEYLCRKKDGSLIDVEVTGVGLLYQGKNCVLVFIHNISDRKRAEEILRASNQQLLDIIELLPDATFVIDRDKKVIAWNKAMEKMTGVGKEEILGQGSYAYAVPFGGKPVPMLIDLIINHEEETELCYEGIRREGPIIYAELFAPSFHGGQGAFLWCKASPLLDSDGVLIGAIESIRDISERKQVEKILQNLTNLDGLTGIANRRHFDAHLDQQWRIALRQSLPLSLVMCDIDFFKDYNDTYGHLCGDDCLKKVAAALNKAINRPGDMVARYGGEEFVVVLPGTDAGGAVLVAENLRKRIEELNIEHVNSKHGGHVTISLGVATIIPGKGSSTAALIYAADQAMYAAKRDGSNCVRTARDR
jgi:diguanylate cyclase (GGDEF)-like protein/PAS domain S-box-containing protein